MVRKAVFLITTGGWKDFMCRNEKFLDFAHPHNLLEYFQNKESNSNKTLQKHQYTNGSIKEQQFLNRGSKNFIARTEKRKKVPVREMLESSAFLSSFIMENEERQVYNSYII